MSVLLITGCSSKFIVNDTAYKLARSAEIVASPFFPQDEFQCGPAALATVLNFYGHTLTPAQLEPQLFIPGKQGSLAIEMLATSRRYDMLAVEVEPSIEALLLEISQGHPVVVFQNLGFDWYPQWHFAVVVGYDLDRDEMVLRSGTRERLITPFHVFMKTWQRADYWALVVRPAGKLPASNNVHNTLKATTALEQLGRYQAAYESFAAIVQRWPESQIAWMGLGNTAYALKNFPQAESAFRKAIENDSHYHPAWNNLAYTLVAQGCPQQALQAVQCAINLSLSAADYASSLQEISRQDAISASSCVEINCPLIGL